MKPRTLEALRSLIAKLDDSGLDLLEGELAKERARRALAKVARERLERFRAAKALERKA